MNERSVFGSNIPLDFQVLTEDNSCYVSSFHCGNLSIDYFFQQEAVNDQQTVTYLFIDLNADTLLACVTLSCSAICVDSVEPRPSTVIPAMEVVYFAVDKIYQQIPYSEESSFSLSVMIMRYMLDYMWELSHNKIGAEKVVLYAVPRAVNFYKRCLFKRFDEDMLGDKGTYLEGCIPMFFNLN